MKGEAQDKQPILLGAVDLGSNSFRVEIGRVEDYPVSYTHLTLPTIA